MIGLVLVGVLLDRRGLTMRLVAWAAAVILVFRPESLLGASFQLSFAAVVALIAVYEAIRARRTFTDRGSSRISHRRIVWSLIIYCKQTVIEIFGKRQKYRVFFRSGPFFVRRREGLHGFGDPLQGAPRRRPVFPVLQHIDDRLVG